MPILDTNVLWGRLTRDLLFTLAELDYYEVILSNRIIDALQRYGVPKRVERLMREGKTSHEATQEAHRYFAHLLTEIRSFFIDQIYNNYEEHIELCENDEGDRHVLALAIANNVQVIVTENLKHFPASALRPHGVQAISLDTFLSQYFSVAQLFEALKTISRRYNKPPLTVEELINLLEQRHQLTQTVTLLRGDA